MYESCAQTYLVVLFISIFIKLIKKEEKNLFKYFCTSISCLIIGILGYWVNGKITLFILQILGLEEKNYVEPNNFYMGILYRMFIEPKEFFKKIVFVQGMLTMIQGLIYLLTQFNVFSINLMIWGWYVFYEIYEMNGKMKEIFKNKKISI